MLVQVQATLILIQLPANVPEKEEEDDQNFWAPSIMWETQKILAPGSGLAVVVSLTYSLITWHLVKTFKFFSSDK